MGNHNILITNPSGGRKEAFHENVGLDECKKWMEEFGPAPIGWHYQIVNHNKKVRRPLDHILVKGYGWVKDKNGNESFDVVDERKTRTPMNNGTWYTPKKAKKHMRAMGAYYFTKEKVWKDVVKADGNS